jgi:hypothetical protein
MEKRKPLIKIGVDVIPVKKTEVDNYWSLLQLMIMKGLEHNGNLLTEAQLRQEIKEGYHQLFIIFGSEDGEENELYGVFITRITDHPNGRQCEVTLLSGKKRELWEDQVTLVLQELALSNHCNRIAVLARPGWKKLGEKWGFKIKNYEFIKELNHG